MITVTSAEQLFENKGRFSLNPLEYNSTLDVGNRNLNVSWVLVGEGTYLTQYG